ncbi:hypothetical protein FHQ08_12925 [Lactobacillus sp. CC-MHH1034]|uniref:hypothetical protein n=1 Tax=Agrilactobacillus fermenti TaxID=2586909 RepID=UPI001E3FCCD5|nr:hypothetical protein [Agrilactobacillus fermenti]MCD2257573.1 hypothetical protein [Agrilactobacillus fermenti]
MHYTTISTSLKQGIIFKNLRTYRALDYDDPEGYFYAHTPGGNLRQININPNWEHHKQQMRERLKDNDETKAIYAIFQWLSRYTSGKSLVSARRNLAMKNGRKTTQLERIEIAEWVIVNDMDYTGATKQYDISWRQQSYGELLESHERRILRL